MARGATPFSMRGLAAFAGGAAAAFIASRVLPPLMAQAAGAARAAAGRDPFDALAHDRREILALLADMERTPARAALERTQRLLRLKRRLTAHALAEEDVIYPLLREQANEVEDARRLYGEHAEMKVLLHALERMPASAPQWRDKVGELRTLIEGHARHEEEIDFPTLRSILDRRALTRLSGHVQREKALVL